LVEPNLHRAILNAGLGRMTKDNTKSNTTPRSFTKGSFLPASTPNVEIGDSIDIF
jgi:hypothetical protein